MRFHIQNLARRIFQKLLGLLDLAELLFSGEESGILVPEESVTGLEDTQGLTIDPDGSLTRSSKVIWVLQLCHGLTMGLVQSGPGENLGLVGMHLCPDGIDDQGKQDE